jgi:uncharacterized membrane protein YjdF
LENKLSIYRKLTTYQLSIINYQLAKHLMNKKFITKKLTAAFAIALTVIIADALF